MKMRNLTGSTNYAPVSNSGEGFAGGVNETNTTATKANVLTGQVNKIYMIIQNISNLIKMMFCPN